MEGIRVGGYKLDFLGAISSEHMLRKEEVQRLRQKLPHHTTSHVNEFD